MNESSITISFGTTNLLKIVLALQLAVVGLIGLDFMGIEIPILRQATCFIYLTFMPGILTIRILKLHKLTVIETILYSVGLSLSFLMFIGALINYLYPLIGISKPISEVPLVITLSVVVLFLCFVCYLRDKDYSTSFSTHAQQLFSPLVLSLLLLPFLAIFGTYLLNFYDNNILLLILLAIISIIPALVAFDKIPKEVYPLAIWIISIALLLQHTLISMTISGEGDASVQAYVANSIIMNGIWNPNLTGNVNGQLSIVMLIPIFSTIAKISSPWILKIIYPLLLSLLPLGLYYIFINQTNSNKINSNKIAFFSCFLFMSAYPFFEFLSFGMRQGIAEIFLMLLVLLIIDKTMDKTKRALLLIISVCSLVVSHDGVSFIFMFSLIFMLFLFFISKNFKNQPDDKSTKVITTTFVSLFIVVATGWFMYITSATMFNRFILFGESVVSSITELLSPEHSFAAHILTGEWSLSIQILRIFYIIINLFIIIGILSLFHEPKKVFDEYNALSISFLGILLSTFIPEVGVGMAGHRILIVVLLLLAPFCIVGGMITVKGLAGIITKLFNAHVSPLKNRESHFFKAFSAFLMIFLLLNSGFVSEVIIKDYFPPASWISKERIMQSENVEIKSRLLLNYILDYDTFSAQWMSRNRGFTSRIYLSEWVLPSLYYYIKKPNEFESTKYSILKNDTKIYKKSYIYLNCVNNIEGVMLLDVPFPQHSWYNTSEIQPELDKINKVYDNGGSVIYYS